MGVFGAPIAHGDDVERAVRAALSIRETMSELSTEVSRPMSVHIGIASGRVVASHTGSATHRQYTVIGDSVIALDVGGPQSGYDLRAIKDHHANQVHGHVHRIA